MKCKNCKHDLSMADLDLPFPPKPPGIVVSMWFFGESETLESKLENAKFDGAHRMWRSFADVINRD